MNSITFNPIRIFFEIWRNRYLLGQLVKRDVLLRYRGAMFGILWMFLSPLIMLAIFAFIFGQIFQARWPQQETAIPFWILLYSGLIAFNLFAETISRAPTSVRSYPSFVKKIIFPVNILAVVPLGASLVHGGFNFMILLAALAWTGHLHAGVLLFPVLIVPLILLALGLGWFFAAWGVFIKDMTQIVPVLVQMLLFLSPIFYPSSAVPEMLRPLIQYNPLGVLIESSRGAIVGQTIDWGVWLVTLCVCLAISTFGFAFFQYSKDEFADAL